MVDVSPERLDRLVAGVLDRLPQPKQSRWSQWREAVRDWWPLPAPAPALAYGLPVAVAMWLGVVTGGAVLSSQADADPLLNLLQSTHSFALMEM